MSPTREFQPRKPSFLFRRVSTALTVTALLTGVVLVIVLAAGEWAWLVLLPVLWAAIPLPAAFAANVAFSKERYELHDDHLVWHRGSLLSDGRTELEIRNITHVRLRLPWLRHWFWGIGDVRVESAGSAASEITFESVDDPEGIYQAVLEHMRANGYALEKSEVLHEESPGVVGALTDVAQAGVGGAVSLIFLVFIAMGVLADIGVSGGSFVTGILSVVGGAMALLIPLAAVGGLVVRYLDITRRTYTVYNDAVAYTEGFLTRDNAIIPFENIADASTDRTVVDQVLGLYDVKVSCQGSGSEILFRRLSRGEELRAAIGELVANAGKATRTRQAAQEAAADEADGTEGGSAPAKVATRKLVDPDDAWTAELKMNVMRAQAPLLILLPLFPLWALAAIGVFIQATRTTFGIGPNSMSSAYSFLGSTQQEFAYDKVTGVQISTSPIDTLFNTVAVQIWSIGSPRPLTMPHIPLDDLDLPALLAQCGIPVDDPSTGELKQSFGPKIWLIQNAPGLVFLALIAVGLIVASVFFPPFVLLVLLVVVSPLPAAIATSFRVKRQRVTFHAEHVEAQTGIFFRKHIYVRYDNVKKVETTRIPFTEQGTFKLYVAGEQILQQQQQEGQEGGMKMPYSLEASYIEGISMKVDAMDALMLGLIEPAEIEGSHAQDDDVISVSKPAVANTVVTMLLAGCLFPPLWLAIPLVVWQTKVRSYTVESDRVVDRGGILFKFVTSVLFNRIDSMQQHQGALGKAFGNGQVTIMTAGSSAPDLLIANVPDYDAVYTTIRKNYGKKGAT